MLRRIFRALALAFDTSVFVIRIQDGRVLPVKGRVPHGFLTDLTEAAADFGIQNGVIKARRQQTHIRISFSQDIPAELHQRIRNIWHIYEPGYRTG